jgi:hypothetical protein
MTIKELFMSSTDKAKNSKMSVKWFLSKVKTILQDNRVNIKEVLNSEKSRNKNNYFEIGGMYMFAYDPKWKNVLPYYDTFPIIIVLKFHDNGFTGLNLHYLPPEVRILFLIALMIGYGNGNKKASDLFQNMDETLKSRGANKLFIDYDRLIQNSSRLYGLDKPCIKRYLFNHVRSSINRIPMDDWEYVAALPTEEFKKLSKESVWLESINIAKS